MSGGYQVPESHVVTSRGRRQFFLRLDFEGRSCCITLLNSTPVRLVYEKLYIPDAVRIMDALVEPLTSRNGVLWHTPTEEFGEGLHNTLDNWPYSLTIPKCSDTSRGPECKPTPASTSFLFGALEPSSAEMSIVFLAFFTESRRSCVLRYL